MVGSSKIFSCAEGLYQFYRPYKPVLQQHVSLISFGISHAVKSEGLLSSVF